MVSVTRGFLFILVLGIGCDTLLWHSLGLPYSRCFMSIRTAFVQTGLHLLCSPQTLKYFWFLYKVLTGFKAVASGYGLAGWFVSN